MIKKQYIFFVSLTFLAVMLLSCRHTVDDGYERVAKTDCEYWILTDHPNTVILHPGVLLRPGSSILIDPVKKVSLAFLNRKIGANDKALETKDLRIEVNAVVQIHDESAIMWQPNQTLKCTGNNCVLYFQKDANLVMYDESATAKWSSNTSVPEDDNARLVLTTDFTPDHPGYINIIDIDKSSKMCKLLWTSGH